VPVIETNSRRKGMAAIHDLLAQVQDEALRARLEQEINRLSKTKKFGLVFEEHLPECTPLYDISVKRGYTVAKKTGVVSEMYEVNSIKDGIATCYHKVTGEKEDIPVEDLVSVAQFGEPIYPYLKPIDSICNAPDSDLWHTLIEADNYHALQLLEYLYAGKVDCIYIDPPYNTGARDWKYNNDYVDGADSYRHSKWLSMIQKRLKIAKKLLNPDDSVLIVTIDEKEYLHLGCLLEEMFPNANIQMVSTLIAPQGNPRVNQFNRVDEYIYFVGFGSAKPELLPLSDEWRRNAEDTRTLRLLWQTLMRTGNDSMRANAPNCFYPIFVSEDGKQFKGVGKPLALNEDRTKVKAPDGCVAIWPIHSDGTEARWNHSPESLLEIQKKGYVKLGKFTDRGMAISYLLRGQIQKVESGLFKIEGYNEDGSIISNSEVRMIDPGTQWSISSHDATRSGSQLLKQIFLEKRFTFPKSLYATHDAIRFYVANKPNALIVDFFAGSGTTLHAVNLLNAEDGGNRRCIIVTNNEVSDAEAKTLSNKGFKPGDPEWERLGIAQYVTWPRTVCSIKGTDIKGNPLKGNYYNTEIQMQDGFETNVMYYKLGFLDKTAIALGRQLAELFPVLWLKAGAHGPCPSLEDDKAYMQVLPENEFAILIDEKHFREFNEAVNKHPEIQTIYIVTDSEAGYREMIAGYGDKNTYQLYRDYLDNFRINTGR